jgi:hypothetical protein
MGVRPTGLTGGRLGVPSTTLIPRPSRHFILVVAIGPWSRYTLDDLKAGAGYAVRMESPEDPTHLTAAVRPLLMVFASSGS